MAIPDGLIPIKIFLKRYQWPSESSMKKLYFKRETNGLKDAFFKCGRRLLIDPKIFWDLVRKNGK